MLFIRSVVALSFAVGALAAPSMEANSDRLAVRDAQLQTREVLLESREALMDTIKSLVARDDAVGTCKKLKVRDADAYYQTGC